MRQLSRLRTLLTLLLLLGIAQTLAQQQQQCRCASANGCSSPAENNAVVGGDCWQLIDGILHPQQCQPDCCIFCFEDDQDANGNSQCVGFNGGFCEGNAEGGMMMPMGESEEFGEGGMEVDGGQVVAEATGPSNQEVDEGPIMPDEEADANEVPIETSPPMVTVSSSSPPMGDGMGVETVMPTPAPEEASATQDDTEDRGSQGMFVPVGVQQPETTTVPMVSASAFLSPPPLAFTVQPAQPVEGSDSVSDVPPVEPSTPPEIPDSLPPSSPSQFPESVSTPEVFPSATTTISPGMQDLAQGALSPSAPPSVEPSFSSEEEDSSQAVVADPIVSTSSEPSAAASPVSASPVASSAPEEDAVAVESPAASSSEQQTSTSDDTSSAAVVAATVEPTPDLTVPAENSTRGNSSDDSGGDSENNDNVSVEMVAYEVDLNVKAPNGMSANLNTAVKEAAAKETETQESKWALTEVEDGVDSRDGMKTVKAKYVVVFGEDEEEGRQQMDKFVRWTSTGGMAQELSTKGFDSVEVRTAGPVQRLEAGTSDGEGSSDDMSEESSDNEASGLSTPAIIGVAFGCLLGVGVLTVLGIMFWGGRRGGGFMSRFASERSVRSSRMIHDSDFEDLEDGPFPGDGEYSDMHYGGPGRRETEMTSRTYNVSDYNGEVSGRSVPRGPTVLMRESSIMEWQENTSRLAEGQQGSSGGSSGRMEQLRKLSESEEAAEGAGRMESGSSTSSSYSGIKALDPEDDDLYIGGADGDIDKDLR